MKNKKLKVLVGMSGGVDSSVTAALLLAQGYEVIGAFMKNWSDAVDCDGEKKECGWKNERRDAMRVAAKLGIPFLTFDFEKEYRRDVIDHMFHEFEAGRTPNPDVWCNKYVKFDLFLKEADKLGCDFIATGHYARIEKVEGDEGAEGVAGSYKIFAGSDSNKDQTYFLWAIPPEVLPRVLFPIGDMLKPDVRKKAHEFDLPVADKKDSTGICFVGEVNIRDFLQQRIPKKPGQIVTTTGKVVGSHEGLPFYTIGQREGLNIGGGTPYYVVAKKPATNELVVSSNFEQALFADSLEADSCNWFNQPKTLPFECECRIRYRQPLVKCIIEETKKDTVKISFKEPQRAVTSGQSVVFYAGEEMIGGGIIV
ncbi:MAG: tRNA 2-thiouridine(34) synthase MnmA [Candidatus Uhrbacteria bacterium]